MNAGHYVARIPYSGMGSELLVGPYGSRDEAEPALDVVREAFRAVLDPDDWAPARIDVMEVSTSGDLRPGSRNAEFGLPVDAAADAAEEAARLRRAEAYARLAGGAVTS